MMFCIKTYAQLPYWTLDFESEGGYTTSIPEFTSKYTDYFIRTNGDSTASSVEFENIRGEYYFAAMDIKNTLYNDILPVELNIDDIDISAISELGFSIFLAEDDDGTKQDWDTLDFVHIQYDIDNSGIFTDLMWIRASGAKYNSVPSIDANFDGVGDSIDFVTSTFTEFRADIAGAGSIIDIKIIFSLDAGDEDIAIDNISILGPDRTAPESTWNPEDGAVDILLDAATTLTFDKAIRNIDDSEITDVASLVTLKEVDASGADVSFTASIDDAKKVVTITPDLDLASLSDYYVAFAAVEDVFDNATTLDEITFTTYDAAAKAINLVSPVGGEVYYAGQFATIEWSSIGVTTVDVFVYYNELDTWVAVLENIDSDGSESFEIPVEAEYGDSYRVAIVDVSNSSIADTSEVFGVYPHVSIYEIQSDTIGGASSYDAQPVYVTGIVTHVDETEGYYIQDSTMAWNGIYVSDTNLPVLGDSIGIFATVVENYEYTQLESVEGFSIIESGKDIPEPIVVTTLEASEEMYEGVFIKIINAEITNIEGSFGEFDIDDGSGGVSKIGSNLYNVVLDSLEYVTVQGLGYYSYGKRQILPRNQLDLVSANTLVIADYTVDTSSNIISYIPTTADLATFKAEISVSDSATFEVYDADGTAVASELDETKLLVVSAADGYTTRTYTLVIEDMLSDDATLSSLYVEGVTITGFSAGAEDYTVDLPAGTISIPVVTATATEANADVQIDYATDLTGDEAARTATVTVTAADEAATKTYTVLFNVLTSSIENVTTSELSIYPTKVENMLIVENTVEMNSIQIIDITGSIVVDKVVDNTSKTQLELSELRAGIYMLRAVAGDDIQVVRFIKQ